VSGFQRMKAMTKHRSHSAAFKRQVAQEFVAGEAHVPGDTMPKARKAALRGPSHNALVSLMKCGAGEGIRTLDPNLGKAASLAGCVLFSTSIIISWTM